MGQLFAVFVDVILQFSAVICYFLIVFQQFLVLFGHFQLNFQPNLEANCCVMFIFVRHVMRLLFAFAFSVFLSFGLLWLVFVALI